MEQSWEEQHVKVLDRRIAELEAENADIRTTKATWKTAAKAWYQIAQQHEAERDAALKSAAAWKASAKHNRAALETQLHNEVSTRMAAQWATTIAEHDAHSTVITPYVCPKCDGDLTFYQMVRAIECVKCGWTGQSLGECKQKYGTAPAAGIALDEPAFPLTDPGTMPVNAAFGQEEV